MKIRTFIAVLVLASVAASCASNRAGYRPPKRKKDDCNCSRWSYLNIEFAKPPAAVYIA